MVYGINSNRVIFGLAFLLNLKRGNAFKACIINHIPGELPGMWFNPTSAVQKSLWSNYISYIMIQVILVKGNNPPGHNKTWLQCKHRLWHRITINVSFKMLCSITMIINQVRTVVMGWPLSWNLFKLLSTIFVEIFRKLWENIGNHEGPIWNCWRGHLMHCRTLHIKNQKLPCLEKMHDIVFGVSEYSTMHWFFFQKS